MPRLQNPSWYGERRVLEAGVDATCDGCERVVVLVLAQPRAGRGTHRTFGRVLITEADIRSRLEREHVEDRVAVERRKEVFEDRLERVRAAPHANAEIAAIEHAVEQRVARARKR